MPRIWTPAPVKDVPDGTILFDGVCVLCSRWVRFVAARDGGRFRFVPVQSVYGHALAVQLGIDPAMPESNAVILGGTAYFKSDAALAVLRTLPRYGAAWGFTAAPRGLRDWAYDGVARNRYRLFGRTASCIVPPPGLARRVLHDTLSWTPAVAVVGGTGAFGERLVCGLLAATDIHMVVAARRVERARALADALGGLPRVTAAPLDVASVSAEAL